MEKLNNIINNYNSKKNEIKNNKEEVIKHLLQLRKRAIKLVKNAEETLSKRTDELKCINETICEVQGHTYTEWEEHEGFLDRTWYYTRICQLCGKIERVEEEPFEYRAQLVKKKNKIKK